MARSTLPQYEFHLEIWLWPAEMSQISSRYWEVLACPTFWYHFKQSTQMIQMKSTGWEHGFKMLLLLLLLLQNLMHAWKVTRIKELCHIESQQSMS